MAPFLTIPIAILLFCSTILSLKKQEESRRNKNSLSQESFGALIEIKATRLLRLILSNSVPRFARKNPDTTQKPYQFRGMPPTFNSAPHADQQTWVSCYRQKLPNRSVTALDALKILLPDFAFLAFWHTDSSKSAVEPNCKALS